MDETNKRVVEGYWFGSDQEAELARTEAEKVHYLEERIRLADPQSVLVIYNRAIDNRLFRTPVGIDFLKRQQRSLMERQLGEEIRDIPVFTPSGSYMGRSREEARQREERRQAEEKYRQTRRQLRISLLFNIGLIVIAISMFAIALSSSNPNILNYRTAIENEYSEWEQELRGREQRVREKEKELNIQK